MNFNRVPKSEKLKPIIGIISAIIVFTVIYLGAYYYNLNSVTKLNEEKAEKVAAMKTVDLEDNIILKFTQENKSGEQDVFHQLTVGELKKTLKISDITQEELVTIFEGKGYLVDNVDKAELSFSKKAGTGLNPNKYYIGDKDGKISIFKTDEKGKAFIEKDSDISYAITENYPSLDVERIKGFAREFDTREECEAALTDYTE